MSISPAKSSSRMPAPFQQRGLSLLYVLLGWICLLLGAIGVFLPLIPTTPFVLLAAFCFSRGSQSMHNWLLENKTFGPAIKEWETSRIIRPRAKWLSTIMMSLAIAYAVVFKQIGLIPKAVMLVVLLIILIFIWSCPSCAVKKEL